MNRRLYSILLIVVVAISSCVEDVDFNIRHENKISLNCILSANDTVQFAELHYTDELGTLFFSPVKDAEILLFEDDILLGRFEKESSGRWKFPYMPLPGKRYRIEADISGENKLFAETKVPEKARILRGAVSGSMSKTYIQLQSEAVMWAFIMSPESYVSEFHNEITSVPDGYYLQSDIATNHPGRDKFNMEDRPVDFGDGLQGQYVKSRYYLRLVSEDVSYPLSFQIEGNQDRCITVFRSASEEYDRYLKSSLQKAMSYSSFDDPTSYFEENLVYSNIQGGIGIFGSYADTYVSRNEIIIKP